VGSYDGTGELDEVPGDPAEDPGGDPADDPGEAPADGPFAGATIGFPWASTGGVEAAPRASGPALIRAARAGG